MNVRGCCAPQVLSGMTRKSATILPFLVLYRGRNRQTLRDPVARSWQFNLGPDEFPRFLWEGEKMDESDPTTGFLRHPILFAVRTLTCLSFSANTTS